MVWHHMRKQAARVSRKKNKIMVSYRRFILPFASSPYINESWRFEEERMGDYWGWEKWGWQKKVEAAYACLVRVRLSGIVENCIIDQQQPCRKLHYGCRKLQQCRKLYYRPHQLTPPIDQLPHLLAPTASYRSNPATYRAPTVIDRHLSIANTTAMAAPAST